MNIVKRLSLKTKKNKSVYGHDKKRRSSKKGLQKALKKVAEADPSLDVTDDTRISTNTSFSSRISVEVDPSSIVVVKVDKPTAETKVGISLKKEEDIDSILICSIAEGGLLASSELRVGQKVLSINGSPCPVSIVDAAQLIASTVGTLSIEAANFKEYDESGFLGQLELHDESESEGSIEKPTSEIMDDSFTSNDITDSASSEPFGGSCLSMVEATNEDGLSVEPVTEDEVAGFSPVEADLSPPSSAEEIKPRDFPVENDAEEGRNDINAISTHGENSEIKTSKIVNSFLSSEDIIEVASSEPIDESFSSTDEAMHEVETDLEPVAEVESAEYFPIEVGCSMSSTEINTREIPIEENSEYAAKECDNVNEKPMYGLTKENTNLEIVESPFSSEDMQEIVSSEHLEAESPSSVEASNEQKASFEPLAEEEPAEFPPAVEVHYASSLAEEIKTRGFPSEEHREEVYNETTDKEFIHEENAETTTSEINKNVVLSEEITDAVSSEPLEELSYSTVEVTQEDETTSGGIMKEEVAEVSPVEVESASSPSAEEIKPEEVFPAKDTEDAKEICDERNENFIPKYNWSTVAMGTVLVGAVCLARTSFNRR